MPGRFTFRQLETLMAVAEQGSYAAAARALGISQPAVSKHIVALERRFGKPLFERSRGGASRLTRPGRDIVAQLPSLMEQYRSLAPAEMARPPLQRTVRIGCGDHLAELIGDLLPRFYRRHPGINVHVRLLDPALVSVLRLDAQDVDLAYLTLRNTPDPRVGQVLATVDAGLYGTADVLETYRHSPDASLPLISASDNSYLSREFDARLLQLGIRRHHIVARLPTQTARIRLAAAGIGAVHAIEPSVRRLVARGRLRRFPMRPTSLHRCRFVNPATYRDANVRLVEAWFSAEIART